MKIEIGQFADFSMETLLFASVGNLCGRLVNKGELLMSPSLFTKQTAVNLKAASTLCTLFIVIDNLVKIIFRSRVPAEYNRFFTTVVRLGISFQAAFLVHRSQSHLLNFTPLSHKNSLIILVAAISLHTLVCQIIQSWNRDNHIKGSLRG